MIIDHITLLVSDYVLNKEFYRKALAPLGIDIALEFDRMAGFGKAGKGEFWLGVSNRAQTPMHIAFLADNRDQVRGFYAAALAAGAKDNGAPGPRPIYHANYYGAFVIAPEGHNIEAVCHRPE
jgi:catechol 2,3-dioxygenase-like lactoylglutathione lyase family enzyme